MPAKTIMDYAAAGFECSCGRRHRTDIRQLLIDDHAISQLPSLVRDQKKADGSGFDPDSQSALIIADDNTWQAAGSTVSQLLTADHIKVSQLVFPGKPDLIPDEKAVFQVITALRPHTAVLIAAGSGTINDLVRFVSYKTQKPYICVPTAPSMDGYASSVAPMIHNNLKTTYETWGAAALVTQPDILASCPSKMLAAGLGDILGKYTALADWRLGGIVEHEYECPLIADMVTKTADRSLSQARQLAGRDPQAVRETMEGLLMTGIAMSYAGNSRPASGAEHHLSHFWEMVLMQKKKPPVLHGSKVGLATPMIASLYHHIQKLQPDFERARKKAARFSFDQWAATIENVYGTGAPEVIALGRKTAKNSPDRTLSRLAAAEKNWEQIRRAAADLVPEPDQIYQALQSVGAPVSPVELGIEDSQVLLAVRHAAEMRDRYTVLQLYTDLDLLDEAESIVTQWL